MRKNLHFNVIFRPETKGGFTVIVPALPGCVTYGKDLKEAREMARDAIKGYIILLKKHRESVPIEQESFFGSIDINKEPIYA